MYNCSVKVLNKEHLNNVTDAAGRKKLNVRTSLEYIIQTPTS